LTTKTVLENDSANAATAKEPHDPGAAKGTPTAASPAITSTVTTPKVARCARAGDQT
jgi:hypothetical protein